MKGHSGPIVGLGCQMLQVALISLSQDLTLRAWRIKNGKELEVFKFDERPEKFAYEPRTNMAACALSDGTIELIDCSNAPLKRVRRFRLVLKLFLFLFGLQVQNLQGHEVNGQPKP